MLEEGWKGGEDEGKRVLPASPPPPPSPRWLSLPSESAARYNAATGGGWDSMGGGVYSIVEWRRGEGGLNEKGGRTWAEGERDVNGKGGREGIKKWREEGKSEMEKREKGSCFTAKDFVSLFSCDMHFPLTNHPVSFFPSLH